MKKVKGFKYHEFMDWDVIKCKEDHGENML